MLQYQYYNNIIAITVVMRIIIIEIIEIIILFTGPGPGPSGVVWCGCLDSQILCVV